MRLAGVALFVFAGGSILIAGLAVLVSVVSLMDLSRLARMRRRRAEPRLDFLKELLRGLATRAFKDITDVHDSYRAFFGVRTLRASHLAEIDEFLRKATAQIASARRAPASARLQESIRMLHDLLAVNERAIEVELQCVPFSGTPEPERQLLEDILKAIGEDTKSRVGPKLDALAKGLRIREDTGERLRWESDRCLKLARWGWVGTLVFSILSIILGILSLGG